jgi:cytochrome c
VGLSVYPASAAAWSFAICLAGGMIWDLLAPISASGQQSDGERLFRLHCGACHSLDAGQKKPGPHLSKVIGRRAGSIEGARYSDPMLAADIVWDRTSLGAFLAAPREIVPGTSMTTSVPEAAEREAIITYLEGASS